MEGRLKSFTASDKSFLREQGAKHGISINERCPDCWRDCFLQLRAIYMKEKKTKQNKSEFLGHKTMRWRGIPIDGDTPVEVIETFIADHPNNRNFFRKIEKQKDNGKEKN